jgi:hypothetical protein
LFSSQVINFSIQHESQLEPHSPTERIILLCNRGITRADSRAIPILYRSSLFCPISPTSPSIHVDCLDMSTEDHDSAPITIYVHFYHFSYRHNYDTTWMKQLLSALPQKLQSETLASKDSVSSILRIFVDVTDCNLDYSSAERLNTASRIVIRVGGMRISSNIVVPCQSKQAFSCSIADSEILLCSSRFPYNFENGRLISSPIMKPTDLNMESLGLSDDSEPDDVIQLMNFRTMVTLASIYIQVVFSSEKDEVTDPFLLANVSTQHICVFACKDSLALLADTIGEISNEMTAIMSDTFQEWKLKAENYLSPVNTTQDRVSDTKSTWSRQSHTKSDLSHDFLLDGYDWTAIDSDEIGKPGIPSGDEQSARWYVDPDAGAPLVNHEITTLSNDGQYNASSHIANNLGPPIITHHFNLQPVLDPIGDGDMGAWKYSNSNHQPRVQARVIIRELAVRIRFFDGYDWPELLDEKLRSSSGSECFIIPGVKNNTEDNNPVEPATSKSLRHDVKGRLDKKSKLLDELLVEGSKRGKTFENIPLPDERSKNMKEQAELRRLARRTSKYFQIEANGVVARLDSMEECGDHRLVSCLNLMIHDFFLAESISSDMPVKMLGEWFNEDEHPRDSKEGLILMKVTPKRNMYFLFQVYHLNNFFLLYQIPWV